MKRLLTAFSLLLMAFMFVGNPPANAQTIPSLPSGCQIISGTSTSAWPDGNYSGNCAGSTYANDADSMISALNNIQAYAVENLGKQGVQYFLFKSPASYKTALGSNAATVPAGAWSVTKFDSNNRPIHIAIFEQNSAGVLIGNSPADGSGISHYTVRESGRAVDTMLGYINYRGMIQLPYSSISTGSATEFYAQVQADWTYVNSRSNCGTNGIFVGQTDPRNGDYICANNGQGPGLASGYSGSNQAIITEMIPDVFTNSNDIWSEEYAVRRSGAIQSLDIYLIGFTNYFNCSYQYQNIVEQEGRKPVNGDMSGTTDGGTACPNLTALTGGYCTQVFSQPGGSNDHSYPEYGYIFYCGTASENTANQMAINLGGLGKLGGTVSNPHIKTTLWKQNSYVYLFQSPTEYKTITTDAGVYDAPLPTSPTPNAFTYPDEGIWYSVVFAGTSTASLLTDIATHELGHVDDFTSSTQQSAEHTPYDFDNAMQNDWVRLDYSKVGTTRADSTVQGPCAVGGPLIGAIDPATISDSNPDGSLFCTGTGGYTANDPFAGNNPNTGKPYLTHEILQDPRVDGQLVTIGGKQYPYGDSLYQTDSPSLGSPVHVALPGWREWFAQDFAIQAQSDTGATSDRPELYVIVKQNGYFACTAVATKGWLYSVYTGATVTMPTTCLAANLPSWWTTIH
jgi:hypothetical protein